jgi:hypothetical protein
MVRRSAPSGKQSVSVLPREVRTRARSLDVGLDRLGEREAMPRERYAGSDHPGAREIIGWMDGAYRITDEIVWTQ